jgi:hypothetical protein
MCEEEKPVSSSANALFDCVQVLVPRMNWTLPWPNGQMAKWPNGPMANGLARTAAKIGWRDRKSHVQSNFGGAAPVAAAMAKPAIHRPISSAPFIRSPLLHLLTFREAALPIN